MVSHTPTRVIPRHELLEEADRGLVYNLSTLINRRQVLKLAGEYGAQPPRASL